MPLTAFGLFFVNHGQTMVVEDCRLRHAHWKAFYDHIVVEWLQDILGHGRVIDPCIFVGVETLELVRSDVYHVCLSIDVY